MKILERGIYHIYDRGNNSQTIFFSDENCFFFEKMPSLFKAMWKYSCMVFNAHRTNDAKDYSLVAFHYIHQNPVAAGLVNKPQDWPYYVGLRNGTLCDKQKNGELLALAGIDFYAETIKKIDAEKIKEILRDDRDKKRFPSLLFI